MHKAIGAVMAAVVLATSGIAASASAETRHRNFDRQDRVIGDYCRNHHDNDCRDWNRNRHSWNDDRYRRWYHDHDHDFGAGNAAAAIFGFAAGAITGAITSGATGGHVAACQSRYRSYSRATDTYMGLDGRRYPCRL